MGTTDEGWYRRALRLYGEWLQAGPTRREVEARAGSGVWRATDRGIDFALGRITVPRAYVEYDSKVLGFEPEQVTIQEALGKRFSYAELMGGVA